MGLFYTVSLCMAGVRFVRISLELPESFRHPMHQYVVRESAYQGSKLLHWQAPSGGSLEMIFRVTGPQEPYVDAIEEVDIVEEYHVSSVGESFYLYVRESLSPGGASIVRAFDRAGIVIAPPIEYREDGSMRLSLIGESAEVQAAVEDVPSELTVDVLEVSRYDAQPFETSTRLTARQREAVRAAVECGYYQSPREGELSAVADVLGCSPGTAAEHLRKAEAVVMEQVVDPMA